MTHHGCPGRPARTGDPGPLTARLVLTGARRGSTIALTFRLVSAERPDPFGVRDAPPA
ncbi:hypothetical protein [Longispora urticae]